MELYHAIVDIDQNGFLKSYAGTVKLTFNGRKHSLSFLDYCYQFREEEVEREQNSWIIKTSSFKIFMKILPEEYQEKMNSIFDGLANRIKKTIASEKAISFSMTNLSLSISMFDTRIRKFLSRENLIVEGDNFSVEVAKNNIKGIFLDNDLDSTDFILSHEDFSLEFSFV